MRRAVDNVQVDLGAMMGAKDNAVKGLTRGIEQLFKKNKVSSASVRCAAARTDAQPPSAAG